MLHGMSHWKATIHIYHHKSFKILKIECIHSGLSKNTKSHFGCLGPLGVKAIITPMWPQVLMASIPRSKNNKFFQTDLSLQHGCQKLHIIVLNSIYHNMGISLFNKLTKSVNMPQEIHLL
jgi:hypothetical protein